MPVNFAPIPTYPIEIDSDYTLYLVYNTVETTITADNQPWSDEISIKPRKSTEDDFWPDNGFATISGELLYYDAVTRDVNGNATKLRNCVRNLGGSQTKYNKNGTDIRSFVVAEHHNQLANAIIKIEEFIGTETCQNEDTLVCCLFELDIADCEDDNTCPGIEFNYDVDSSDPCAGTTISYDIAITGNFNNFRLDFGDGTSTLTPTSGTKTYPFGATIDPVVTLSNNLCEIVVTGIERTEDKQPNPTVSDTPLTITIPSFGIPNISVPSITIPDIDLVIPPFVQPCLNLTPFGGVSIGPISIGDINIPSTISVIAPDFGPISIIGDLPSIITIIGDLPSIITLIGDLPSTISLIGDIGPISLIHDLPDTISIIGDLPSRIIVDSDIPSVISVFDTIPEFISIIGEIPTTISLIADIGPISLIADIGPISLIDNLHDINLIVGAIPDMLLLVPSIPDIRLIVPEIAAISVNWGDIPTITCSLQIACPTEETASVTMAGFASANDFNFTERSIKALDDQDPMADIAVEYETLGIPDKIIVVPPKIPPIQIEHNIPTEIKLTGLEIPTTIEVKSNIPSEITVLVPEITPIEIDASGLPKSLIIDWGSIPTLKVEPVNINTTVTVEHDIPTTISIEGMVDTISVIGFPEYLPVRFENPEVSMVYKGDPIEVVVKMETDKLFTDSEGKQCFYFVPCGQ